MGATPSICCSQPHDITPHRPVSNYLWFFIVDLWWLPCLCLFLMVCSFKGLTSASFFSLLFFIIGCGGLVVVFFSHGCWRNSLAGCHYVVTPLCMSCVPSLLSTVFFHQFFFLFFFLIFCWWVWGFFGCGCVRSGMQPGLQPWSEAMRRCVQRESLSLSLFHKEFPW